MKTTSDSRNKSSPPQSALLESETVNNYESSKTIKPTSKTRNFGWLVKGMVEACHQINADKLNRESSMPETNGEK